MVVGDAWHAECRSCDVSRTCAANVMLCRPSQDVSHCSHNSGVRVHACNVTSPITALKSSGADKCAKVLRRDQKQLVVKELVKSLMQPPRHCQAHTVHSRHAAKYVRRQRLAVCARHTKNARTTRRSFSRGHTTSQATPSRRLRAQLHRRPQWHYLTGKGPRWCGSPYELLRHCAHWAAQASWE